MGTEKLFMDDRILSEVAKPSIVIVSPANCTVSWQNRNFFLLVTILLLADNNKKLVL